MLLYRVVFFLEILILPHWPNLSGDDKMFLQKRLLGENRRKNKERLVFYLDKIMEPNFVIIYTHA